MNHHLAGLLGLGCTVWFYWAGWKFFLSTLKAAFFETGDSPKVRAVFVDGTLPEESDEELPEEEAGDDPPDETPDSAAEPDPPANPALPA